MLTLSVKCLVFCFLNYFNLILFFCNWILKILKYYRWKSFVHYVVCKYFTTSCRLPFHWLNRAFHRAKGLNYFIMKWNLILLDHIFSFSRGYIYIALYPRDFIFFILKSFVVFSSVQLLICGLLFATPWTAACQASLSVTNSWSLLKSMSIELVMSSNHILCCPFSFCLQSFPASESFPMSQLFASAG